MFDIDQVIFGASDQVDCRITDIVSLIEIVKSLILKNMKVNDK